ncbi:MAG TPA: hypothetical protein VFA65_13480 [Bryobacteraceae bacterium]|nr:hypothetical protein [Bryobacteraceae bacterium]
MRKATLLELSPLQRRPERKSRERVHPGTVPNVSAQRPAAANQIGTDRSQGRMHLDGWKAGESQA